MSGPLSLAESLARRAASTPEEPWLFYRWGWGWVWRSWGQAADQIARGVEALDRLPPGAVGFDAVADPDALTAGLAAQTAGRVAVPVAGGPEAARQLGCDAWISVGVGSADQPPPRVELPAVRSRLDRRPLRTLAPGEDAARGTLAARAGGAPWAQASSFAAAERLAALLPPLPERPIVLASPSLTPRAVQTLAAWSLGRAAAWALESQPEAFFSAALWTRPHLVLAEAAELAQLAAALTRKRFRRLRTAVVTDGNLASSDEDRWGALGVSVVEMPALV